ncbi:MAG TPA: ribonuclease Z [Haloplasmataceae bacterium]
MLDVCILGCGGSLPILNRYLSATLIRINGKMCLIDCGEGTQLALKQLHWGLKNIDLICLTHFHGDHINGLFGLLSTIGNSERSESLTIIGPHGLSKIKKCIEYLLPNLPYEIIYYENPSTMEWENIQLNTLALMHSAPCLGYSFYVKRQKEFSVTKAIENTVPKKLWSSLQKGQTVNYDNVTYTPDMVLGKERRGIKLSIITDTRPFPDISSFIKNSDLLICEGMYGENTDVDKAIHTKHMTFREAALLAKAGDVKEMILTHFSPSLLEPEIYLPNALEVFKDTIVAHDLLCRTLKFS